MRQKQVYLLDGGSKLETVFSHYVCIFLYIIKSVWQRNKLQSKRSSGLCSEQQVSKAGKYLWCIFFGNFCLCHYHYDCRLPGHAHKNNNSSDF